MDFSQHLTPEFSLQIIDLMLTPDFTKFVSVFALNNQFVYILMESRMAKILGEIVTCSWILDHWGKTPLTEFITINEVVLLGKSEYFLLQAL